jgi:DNA repair protein RadD
MLPDLREYQAKCVAYLRKKEEQGKHRTCVQGPTGSGKTRTLAELLLDPVPQIVFTHRQVLLDQISAVLTSYGIRHGLRANGKRPDLAAPIQLALWQTEYSRVFKSKRWPMHEAKRAHVDEIHSFGGASVGHVIDSYHKAGSSIIGYTATPDEIGVRVDDLYVVATVPELIGLGYLVPVIVYGPDMPDVDKLESVGRQANGDYSPAGLKKIWKHTAVFGSVIANYHKLNPNHKPTILYAGGVPESLWFAQELTRSGVRAGHVDGDDVWIDGKFYKSDTGARQGLFDGVSCGDIKIVCNRYVLREGVDCPALECAILATVYGTRSGFVQSVGRILRPFPGKEYGIVIDHGGNWLRHPAIDDDEPWDMRMPARVAAQIRTERIRSGEMREPICCYQCSAIRVSGDECPQCGYRSGKSARRVLQVNGELKLQTGPAYRKRRVVRPPDAAQIWRGIFFGNRKNHPERTPQQAWCFNAQRNYWNFLPRDLPLMPKTARGWFVPFGQLSFDDLIEDDRFADLPKFGASRQAA